MLDNANFKEFFNNSLTGFLITDPAGVIIHANKRFADWVKVKPEELPGKRFSDYLSISGKIYVETHLAPLLRMQGTYDEIALELAPATGARIPVLMNARERKNDNGDPTSITFVIFKSTQRHQYEADLLSVRNELRALNENLAQKIELEVQQRLTVEGRYNAEHEEAQFREQFIAILGHDLRNPLAGMESGLKMVLRTPLNEKATNLVSLMQNSVERMNALVSDLTDFARSRMGGGIRLHCKTVQLEPVITHVVNEISAASPAKKIKLHLDFPDLVECDPMRISQLVSNLVANAVSHGETGGTVEVNGFFSGSILEISVTNKGAAIPSEILDRIFQPFTRNETGQARPGLGLVLYISSEIARSHDGELKVQSTAEKTKFTFRMPKIQSTPKVSEPQALSSKN